jgi:hypothetical protein
MVAEIVILLIVMFPIILRIFRAVRSLCVELVFGVGVSLDNMVTLGVRFLTLVLEAVGETYFTPAMKWNGKGCVPFW